MASHRSIAGRSSSWRWLSLHWRASRRTCRRGGPRRSIQCSHCAPNSRRRRPSGRSRAPEQGPPQPLSRLQATWNGRQVVPAEWVADSLRNHIRLTQPDPHWERRRLWILLVVARLEAETGTLDVHAALGKAGSGSTSCLDWPWSSPCSPGVTMTGDFTVRIRSFDHRCAGRTLWAKRESLSISNAK
jgi:hypothetical protein